MAKEGNTVFPSHWRHRSIFGEMMVSINNARSLFKIQLFSIKMKACEQILSLDAHFMRTTLKKQNKNTNLEECTDRGHLSLRKCKSDSVVMLFTDSTFNFHCCPVHIWLMLLIFSLALITGNKPLMPALQENPQLCDKGAYQNARNPDFPGSLSQLEVKRQKARDYAEMCA